jgi:protein TonB
MKQTGRAFMESLVLHGAIAGVLIMLSCMITSPPKTIRVDFSLMEQVAAPSRQVSAARKDPAPQPHPLPQSHPVEKTKTLAKSPPELKPRKKIITRTLVKKINPSNTQQKIVKKEFAPASQETNYSLQAADTAQKHNSIQKKSMERQQTNGGSQEKADFVGKSSKLYSYLNLVRLRIEHKKRYPLWARSHRLEGKVLVRFILHLNGQVSAVSVSKSSGRDCLDEAAIEAVQQASPMPPPPYGILSKATPMKLTIVFKLT